MGQNAFFIVEELLFLKIYWKFRRCIQPVSPWLDFIFFEVSPPINLENLFFVLKVKIFTGFFIPNQKHLFDDHI